MDTLHHFKRLFEYNAWANREVVVALKSAEPLPQDAVRRLGHVVGSENMWLARLQQEASPATWPDLSLPDCERELSDIAEAWHKFFQSLKPEQLEDRVTYVNTQGESWTNTVEDILMHVVMHSAYHRGQIAVDMRAAGFNPAYTDYIHAMRQSLVVG